MFTSRNLNLEIYYWKNYYPLKFNLNLKNGKNFAIIKEFVNKLN